MRNAVFTFLALAAAGSLIGCGRGAGDGSQGQNLSPDGGSADYRCRIDQPDGSCVSTPANCPVTIAHPDVPHCGSGILIRADDDQCAHKAICVD